MLVMDQESLQVLAYSTSPSACSGIHAPPIFELATLKLTFFLGPISCACLV